MGLYTATMNLAGHPRGKQLELDDEDPRVIRQLAAGQLIRKGGPPPVREPTPAEKRAATIAARKLREAEEAEAAKAKAEAAKAKAKAKAAADPQPEVEVESSADGDDKAKPASASGSMTFSNEAASTAFQPDRG